MAPEISPVPSAPQSRRRASTASHSIVESSPSSSRRPSQVMGPPAPSLGADAHTGGPIPGEQGSIQVASGPLRHPKPLTPSDIHSLVEHEQEAMVNRLSRELSQLRQQTASVASTASSASAAPNDPIDTHHTSPYLGTPATPASRRHRSSSSLSSSYIPAVQGSRTGSISGIAPSRDTGLPSQRPGEHSRSGRSREPSFTSPRPLEGASASLSSSGQQMESLPHHASGPHAPYSHRSSLSQQRSPAASISRHEEVVHQRGEWESLKRDNDILRRRVRELEQTLKNLREQGPHPRDQQADPSEIQNVSIPAANVAE
ncbi:hypothetical protein P168DRAFT_291954 [Aspergillus campestris IBT 28561]|uniref:Uncharacterized protein n=1 Tax=Aspergillus campestris (strain IBT 28561) TaxID=1392248 RepID=A0A2I1CYY4_ASPC2|nr:uncharacterized protein P168DRAFT_291954 [Aspergillus campestris IBT 28561]PKY02847.1 hypothetical protein P168DRAFT_291954 [Aspergillus campestris IBT 28561]